MIPPTAATSWVILNYNNKQVAVLWTLDDVHEMLTHTQAPMFNENQLFLLRSFRQTVEQFT